MKMLSRNQETRNMMPGGNGHGRKLNVVCVYFNANKNGVKPWFVGGCERRAISETFGNFTSAETAIIHAVEMARIYNARLDVPQQFNALAVEIQDNDARYDELRINDSIGQLESTQAWGF